MFGRDSTEPCEACSWIISFHVITFFAFLGLFRVSPGRGAPTARAGEHDRQPCSFTVESRGGKPRGGESGCECAELTNLPLNRSRADALH